MIPQLSNSELAVLYVAGSVIYFVSSLIWFYVTRKWERLNQ